MRSPRQVKDYNMDTSLPFRQRQPTHEHNVRVTTQEAGRPQMSNVEIELFVDAKAMIGESPIWVAERNAIYWIDVKFPTLFRTDFLSRDTLSWSLPSEIGGYALNRDGSGAIVALRTGIFALSFEGASLRKLCDPPFDSRLRRFNEGDCDATGRFWIGTMFDPINGLAADPSQGYLYSYTLNGALEAHDDPSLLHNGFAWSPAGEFFLAHSREGQIYAHEFCARSGKLGKKRIVTEIARNIGVPDGGAFDEEGYYWSAIHGGGCLHRYSTDGKLDRTVHLPIRNPTMIAFCGPELRDLCVTSATHGKSGNPLEGGIFLLKPGVAGLRREHYIT